MINVFLGFLLLMSPLLLVFCFEKRQRGFLYVFSGATLIHLFIALTTQGLHIFVYPVIIGLNSIIALSSLILFFKYKKSLKIKFNWLILAAFIIIIFELWSVHYFYSGSVGTINGIKRVERTSYSYPYFSDEWVGVSLTNYAITHNKLPMGNSLTKNGDYTSFQNILICFFSLLAELFLLVNLSPLIGYSLFALISGIIICLLAFITIRQFGLSVFSATIGAMFVPFIVNGQNIPGTWYLIPFTGGLIFFLISLSSIKNNDLKLCFISWALAALLYPPITIFILPSMLGLVFSDSQKNYIERIKVLILGLLIFLVSAILIISFQKYNFNVLADSISQLLLHPALDEGIVDFTIWNVLPLIILPFSLIGFIEILKNKLYYLLFPIITGLIFWIVYSQTMYFLIISYERVVVSTSFLLIILAAFGLEKIIEILSKKTTLFSNKKIILSVKIVCLLIFAYFSWNYTSRDNWSKVTLNVNTEQGVEKLAPMPPASEYLTADDLFIFKKINKTNFLSLPWKGLTIGSATENYPLETKPSFITNKKLSYPVFIGSNCDAKKDLAISHRISYVYSSAFTCPNFQEYAVSRENLHLYKFKK